MKINNCYEAALRMFELSEELSILLNENQKAKTEREKEILSGKIDRVEMDFLTLKHSLDKIPYEEKKLSGNICILLQYSKLCYKRYAFPMGFGNRRKDNIW